ncbi:unnamed protein product [Bursaphelenchus xylophilus]|uniref:(pine wood nematode) hypothetical protein n=1 Tax=Bursaphelenchus xylophilus TaxID=6326 RepID=A0A1I7RZ65_BURXY|nr:unnamed protein product [Bursaphelenchus xylophilus]CAG9106805.1 unnamed protein product [Bursaphelenchus xylophilus]
MTVDAADEFGKAVFSQAVAKILDNMGFSASTDEALHLLSALMKRYFEDLCKRTALYKENAQRKNCTFGDINRAFLDQGIVFSELHDYVLQVGNLPVTKVPPYPVKKLKDAVTGYYSEKPKVYINPDEVPSIESLGTGEVLEPEVIEMDEPRPSTSEAMDTSDVDSNGEKEKVVVKQKLYTLPAEKAITIPNFLDMKADDLGIDFTQKPAKEEPETPFNKSYESFTFTPVKSDTSNISESHQTIPPPIQKSQTPVLKPIGPPPLKLSKPRNFGMAPFLPPEAAQVIDIKEEPQTQVQPSLVQEGLDIKEKSKKHKKEKKKDKEKKKEKDKNKEKKHREKKEKVVKGPLPPMPGLDRFESFPSAPILAPISRNENKIPTPPVSVPPPPPMEPISISIPSSMPPALSSNPPLSETLKIPSGPPKLPDESKETPPPTLEPAEATVIQPAHAENKVEEAKKDKHHKKDKDKKEKKKKRDKEKKEGKKRDHEGHVLPPVTSVITSQPSATMVDSAPMISKPAGIKIKFKLGGQNSIGESFSPPKDAVIPEEPPRKQPKLEPISIQTEPAPLKVEPLRISPPKPFIPTQITPEPSAVSNEAEKEKKEEPMEITEEPKIGELPKSPKKHKKEKKHKRDKEREEGEDNGEKREKHKKKSKDKERKEKKEKKKHKEKEDRPIIDRPASNLDDTPPKLPSEPSFKVKFPSEAKPETPVIETPKVEPVPVISTMPIPPAAITPSIGDASIEKDKKKKKKEKKQKKDKEEKKDKEGKKEKKDKEKKDKPKKDKEKEVDASRTSTPKLVEKEKLSSSAALKPKIKPDKQLSRPETPATRPSSTIKEPISTPTPPKTPVDKIPRPSSSKTKTPKASKPRLKKGKKGKGEGDDHVWVCPKCSVAYVDGAADMVGCDGCDQWYHWHCVGMVRPPADDQDWFCPECTKKRKGGKIKGKKN